MAIGELVVRLGLDASDFVSGMTKSEAQAKRHSERIQASTVAAARTLALYAGGFATAAGAIGIFVKSQADAIDKLNDVADATGATIENISALEDVARRNGESLDTAASILVKFNSALKESDPNSGTAATLKALGLDAAALKREDPAEALRLTAVALSGFADNGTKARYIQELFGKSVRDAAPFLKDLAEQTRLTGSQTTKSAADAERFNKNLAELGTTAGDVGRAIANQLIPPINKLFSDFKEGGLTKALGLDGAASRIQQLVDGYQLLSLTGERLMKTLVLKVDPGNTELIAQLAAMDEQARKLARSFQGARDEYLKTVSAGTSAPAGFNDRRYEAARLPELDDKGSGGKGGRATRAAKEIDKVAEALAGAQRELALFGQSESFAKVFDLEGLGASARQLDQYRSALQQIESLQLADSIRATVAALETQRTEFGLSNDELTIHRLLLQGASAAELKYAESTLAATRALREQQEQADRLKTLLDATPSAQLDRDRADMALLTREFEAGRLGVEKYTEAVVARLGLVGKELQQIDPFAAKAAESIQGALGDGLYDALNGNFKNIGDSFVQTINRMVAEAAAADLAKVLLGDLVKDGSGSGVLGGLFKTVFGSSGGAAQSSGGGSSWFGTAASWISSFFGGGKAIGGPTMANTMYQVGERRPEVYDDGSRQWLLTGSRRGRIDPSPQFGGGRPMTVNNTFVLPGQTDKRTQTQIAAAVGRGVALANARNN